MRRALRWIGWSIATLIVVPAVLVLVVLVGANTPPGQTLIARLAPRLTGGLVTIEGLSGRFPDRLNAARLSLHDKKVSGRQSMIWTSTGIRYGSFPAISRSTGSRRRKSPFCAPRRAREAHRACDLQSI